MRMTFLFNDTMFFFGDLMVIRRHLISTLFSYLYCRSSNQYKIDVYIYSSAVLRQRCLFSVIKIRR